MGVRLLDLVGSPLSLNALRGDLQVSRKRLASGTQVSNEVMRPCSQRRAVSTTERTSCNFSSRSAAVPDANAYATQ